MHASLLYQIGNVQWHFLYLCVVKLFDVMEFFSISVSHEIDSCTFSTECSTTSNASEIDTILFYYFQKKSTYRWM
jgi:hypothetical protein